MVVLLFAVLLAVSAAIVVMTVISMRKRRRRAEEEEQHRKAEQDAKQRAAEKERQQLEEKRRKAEERKHLEEEAQQRIEEETRRKVEEEQRRLADELQKAEEERKRIEEEKRRRAQEEEQRRKTEKEAQERAEKEGLKRIEAGGQRYKEEPRKVEEEHKRVEEEAEQKIEETRGGGRGSPLERGGRPRGSTKRHKIEQTPGTKPRSLKPEIVCWNEGWRWIVAVEVPEGLETLSVAQNEKLLECDSTDELRYRLKHAEGAIKATWAEGEKDIPLVGAGRNYLIFKMRKEWKGLGRLVKCPSTGHYLAIVPQEWKRDEEVSGPAPDAPESVQLEGYKAHFFYQEQNTLIGFITGNGERIRVESGGPRFQLVGREIGDASEDMGPLFGEQPPSIGMIAEQGWSDVGVVVVGEEGGGQNRWRMQFVPHVGAKEQKLPEEIAERRGGWYFVRIYDNNDDLLESMDFRFMTALKDIRMESSDCLPGPNGHDNVIVQFLHQPDCKAELVNEDTQHALEIRRERGQTIVTVPPKPDCDKTYWILHDGEGKVEVTVLVERIWWAFSAMGEVPTDWVDKPIILSRKDFIATIDKALWVRFPRTRWVRNIPVDFNRAKPRSFPVEVGEKEIAIPLRDFCTTKEIENRQEEARMMIWVQLERAKPNETVVVKVPADQPPPVKQEQQQVQKIVLEEEKVRLLRANIKCQRGKRKGKGFSRKELTKAEIAIGDVKHLHIPYDKRRRTSHLWNIEDLKYITER